MPAPFKPDVNARPARWWPALFAAWLAACGGGGQPVPAADSEPPATLASGVKTLELAGDSLSESDAARMAQPSFHVAPVLLPEPDDSDTLQPGASATRGPSRQAVPAANAGLPTRRLTVARLLEAQRRQRLASTASGETSAQAGSLAPAVGGGQIVTYTPAQVRAAYGMPALPAAGSVPSATQAAQLGAGQTVYVIGAHHNPNVAAELAAFNQKFGLPGCTTKAIAVTATLPLAAASASACELSVVYTSTGGSRTATAPAYDPEWATELALDVQWAHATAPLARIVLIEAPDASVNSLLGAIRLANAMGPGVVSMSFGGSEGSYTAQVDSAFAGSGMSYLAATGDWGSGVYWPSVSPQVLAVGGTTLTWSGSGSRSESAWSGTGGGLSAYTARPAYQTAAVPGLGTPVRRMLADVAFNADPASGQYVAVMTPGSSTVNWISVGGTSLSTPQWAGLLAVANAMRAQAGKPLLAAAHGVLYQQIAAVPGSYAGAFADIVQGSNGACTLCTAGAGYDSLTGLGTPQAGALLGALGAASAAISAPVVAAASVSGRVGSALSHTAKATSANPVTWSLTGAPSGMSISSTGALTWPAPVAGSYGVKLNAKDSKTSLVGQGTLSVTIVAAQAPMVASATVAGQAGKALNFVVAVTSPNPVSFTLAGAPSGMRLASNGVLSWPSPVAGTHAVQATARDSKTGLTGKGTVTVQIAAAGGLSISAVPMSGVAGRALTGSIVIDAPGASGVSTSIGGVPLGMVFIPSGTTLAVNWANPVKGSYRLTVVAKDSLGRTASATLAVTITAP